MFTCDVCGGAEFREAHVSEVFCIEGRHILVEHIPAYICGHCGETAFSRETTEKVRQMVHGESERVGVVQMDVFEFV